MRSIPNSPGIRLSTGVVNFGRYSDETGTHSIDHESIIITDRYGTDMIICTLNLYQVLPQVAAALNPGNVPGYPQ